MVIAQQGTARFGLDQHDTALCSIPYASASSFMPFVSWFCPSNTKQQQCGRKILLSLYLAWFLTFFLFICFNEGYMRY